MSRFARNIPLLLAWTLPACFHSGSTGFESDLSASVQLSPGQSASDGTIELEARILGCSDNEPFEGSKCFDQPRGTIVEAGPVGATLIPLSRRSIGDYGEEAFVGTLGYAAQIQFDIDVPDYGHRRVVLPMPEAARISLAPTNLTPGQPAQIIFDPPLQTTRYAVTVTRLAPDGVTYQVATIYGSGPARSADIPSSFSEPGQYRFAVELTQETYSGQDSMAGKIAVTLLSDVKDCANRAISSPTPSCPGGM